MKQILLSLTCFLFLFAANATIRRVGYTGAPVANIDYTYTNMQAAINNANTGDTIQVYQQLGTYYVFAVDVNKPLKIIGFGHTLNVNSGFQIQNRKDSSDNIIENITFSSGSAGSIMQGLNIGNCYIGDSNITVKRCRFKRSYVNSGYNSCSTGLPFLTNGDGGGIGINAYQYNLKNITINGCYFDRAVNATNVINYNGTYTTTNLYITNNYFNGSVNLFTGTAGQIYGVFANNIVNYQLQNLSNAASYNNNVCASGTFPNSFWYKTSNFDFFMIKNNIFNVADTTTCCLNAVNCVVQNNLFTTAATYACPSLVSSSNIYSANMSTVFSSAWNNGMVYNDNQLALGAASAAINAGVKENLTATNCGIFGGETGQDYKLSGMPPVPSFYLLTTPGINATTNPFNVTFSVKSNN